MAPARAGPVGVKVVGECAAMDALSAFAFAGSGAMATAGVEYGAVHEFGETPFSGKYWRPTPVPAAAGSFTNAVRPAAAAVHQVPVPGAGTASLMDED
jgi:hypothetical protein